MPELSSRSDQIRTRRSLSRRGAVTVSIWIFGTGARVPTDDWEGPFPDGKADTEGLKAAEEAPFAASADPLANCTPIDLRALASAIVSTFCAINAMLKRARNDARSWG